MLFPFFRKLSADIVGIIKSLTRDTVIIFSLLVTRTHTRTHCDNYDDETVLSPCLQLSQHVTFWNYPYHVLLYANNLTCRI